MYIPMFYRETIQEEGNTKKTLAVLVRGLPMHYLFNTSLPCVKTMKQLITSEPKPLREPSLP